MNFINWLLGVKTVTDVLSKFSKLERDLEQVLDYHTAKADYHAAEAGLQQNLVIQSTKALQAVKTLLGN